MSLVVNRRDLDFLLYECSDLRRILEAPRYSAYDPAAIKGILDTVEAIAEERFLPCASDIDANEPQLIDGVVEMLPSVAEALEAYVQAGLSAASFEEKLGGWQMPIMVSMAVRGILACANYSVMGYPFLSEANAAVIASFGGDAQKDTYLPAMLAGRWFGTMCLSEPQAGSSLSDIRTRADPVGNGLYSISGSKMWISGGDHELSENIVHLVLARLPDGPPGVKGLSLFIVPKFRVNPDGSLGERNDVVTAGLNHKMGQRGLTNCFLKFGEDGACLGTLLGEPNKGLTYMFQMMNEARIGVGLIATMLGLAGYLYSLDYARTRLQGRQLQDKDPSTPQIPIIEHADVKRMLLAQKAYVEGAYALALYCAQLVDEEKIEADEGSKSNLTALLDLLTPVAKSWPSEYCLEANKLAIQILGGYGYSREYPVERFYRDNRLNHIHEGAYGIQALDLLARKMRTPGKAGYNALVARVQATIDAAAAYPALDGECRELMAALDTLEATTDIALGCQDLNLATANATLYLDAFGHIIIAWMWLSQAVAAHKGLSTASSSDIQFYSGKLSAFHYFYRYELPKALHQLSFVSRLDDTCLAMRPEQFIGV